MGTLHNIQKRLVLALRLAALVFILATLTLWIRSISVDEEWSWSSTRRRLALGSSAGSLTFSNLRHGSGTVQTMRIPFASGVHVEQFVGTEDGFATSGWSYAHSITDFSYRDPIFPHYRVRPFPPEYLTTTPPPPQVEWIPLKAPPPSNS